MQSPYVTKLINLAIYVSIAALVAITGACTDNTDNGYTSGDAVAQEWREFTRSLGDYTEDQRDQAARAIEQQMAKMDREIDQLETAVENQADDVSDTVGRQHREMLAEVKEQRREVAEWADRVGSKTEQAWTEVVDGFSDAYEKLALAFEEAEAELGS